jgi:hypothetical protein
MIIVATGPGRNVNESRPGAFPDTKLAGAGELAHESNSLLLRRLGPVPLLNGKRIYRDTGRTTDYSD